jgi:pterin-4a-carbinolamine dehydratase
MHSPWDYTDPNWAKKKSNNDPTAKRPNRLCDPYGQGGQPLSYETAERLRMTLNTDWIFDMPPKEVDIPPQLYNSGRINSNSNNNEIESSPTTSSDIISAIGNDNDGKKATDMSTYTSAEEVQRAISNLEQRSSKMSTATAIGRTSLSSSSNNNHTIGNTDSNQHSSPFPMLTASEEVQRAFASLPRTSVPLQLQPQESTKQSSSSSSSGDSSNTTTSKKHQGKQSIDSEFSKQANASQQQTIHPPPIALIRSFQHPDFMSGTRFLHTIASVAQLNAHYPTLSLERKIIHRQWYVISTVKCHTLVLGGLSSFDFHLATVTYNHVF